MSYSPMVNRVGWAYEGNYTKGREEKLRGIVIHHACATTLQSVINTFQTPGRNGSAHYVVRDDQVGVMVNEEDTAWHCSNWHGNCRTIGIEVCNANLDDYAISDKSFDTLCKLVADIAKRNGFGKLEYLPDGDGTGITGHKDWVGAYTDCPGQLYPRLAEIAQKANDINYPPKPQWGPMGCPRQMITKEGATLYELPSMKVVKTFEAGTYIDMETKALVNGVWYYRSDYSTAKDLDCGIPFEQLMDVPQETEPEPQPEPEEDDDTPNWFIRFIKKLGEFFVNLFKKGD